MEEKIIVSVTAEDIAAGVKADCTLCPIAIAATRALGEKAITYGRLGVLVGMPPEHRIYDTVPPLAMHEFMSAFDNGMPVAPFTFGIRRAR